MQMMEGTAREATVSLSLYLCTSRSTSANGESFSNVHLLQTHAQLSCRVSLRGHVASCPLHTSVHFYFGLHLFTYTAQ